MRKFNPFDQRVTQRYIEGGILTKEEYQEHLKKLPDESKNAVWVEIESDSDVVDSKAREGTH